MPKIIIMNQGTEHTRGSTVERRAEEGVRRFQTPPVSEAVYRPWARGEVAWNDIHRRSKYRRLDERQAEASPSVTDSGAPPQRDEG
jgi:hypothetical protein